LRIDPIPMRASEVRHTTGKLSRRATTLVQNSFRSALEARSYEHPKSQESKPRQFRDSTLGIPGKRAIWMQVRRRVAENIVYGGRWWPPPSPGRGESSESKVARGLSQHWKCAEWVLTNLLVGFRCRTK